MKCPLCNDSGYLFAYMEGGVPPQCSCPIKSAEELRHAGTPGLGQTQQQAELPTIDELADAQAQ